MALSRRQKVGILATAFLWVGGMVLIWYLMPVGPRDGWQVPSDELPCGFLEDDRTLVTYPRSASGSRVVGTQYNGPLRLRDVETGQLLASHWGPADAFTSAWVVPGHDLIKVEQLDPQAGDAHTYRLRLIDAWSGADVAVFSCHVPRDNVWWLLTADAKKTAYVTYENDEPRVELRDIASGQLIHTWKGCKEGLCFSPDGQRLAAVRDSTLAVFDVETGGEIACLTPPPRKDNALSPKMFSANGNLLLDDFCNVWDLNSGQRRFQVPGIYYNSLMFSPDGQTLIVAAASNTDSWLVFYDVATGEEIVERRVPLATGDKPGMHVGRGTKDGRLLLADGTVDCRKPTPVEVLLSKLPGLQEFGQESWIQEFVLVETNTGKVIIRGGGYAASCTDDGRYLLTWDRGSYFYLWDVPARKPLRWLVPAFGLWSLVAGGAVWFICRRKRRIEHAEAPQPALRS